MVFSLFWGKSLKIACSRFDDPAGALVWPAVLVPLQGILERFQA